MTDTIRQPIANGNAGQEQKLRDEILGDARKKAERTLNRAEKDVEKAGKKQEKELQTLEQKRLEEAEKQAGERANAVLARIDHEKKRRAIIVCERIVARVVDAATARFAQMDKAELQNAVERWLQEGLEAMHDCGGTVEVSLGSSAASDKMLASMPKGWKCIVSDSADDPGVLLESTDGSRLFDNSLSARKERFLDDIRVEISRRLGLESVFDLVHSS
jgi:vacuolar-type H+-ATPase subunit E/Vma4